MSARGTHPCATPIREGKPLRERCGGACHELNYVCMCAAFRPCAGYHHNRGLFLRFSRPAYTRHVHGTKHPRPHRPLTRLQSPP
eukprot:6212615-Pleurochrysis_carterae.AAC.1